MGGAGNPAVVLSSR